MRIDVCTNCKSTETYTIRRSDGSIIQADWRKDNTGKTICKRCYNILIANPRYLTSEKIRYHNRRRVTYKRRVIRTPLPIRKGICQKCGTKDSVTSMHHNGEYVDSDPLLNTIEVCRRCHCFETWRLGQYPKTPIPPDRRCITCGSLKPKTRWTVWYKHLDGYNCRKCYHRYRKKLNLIKPKPKA